MKIFTITHKEFQPPQNPLYVPLHVGHIKYSDGTFPEGTEDFGYIGDDTGENISHKNNLYGELTGLYWIWKNCRDVDYVGLVHYRRYFAHDNGKMFDEADYRDILGKYDVIIGKHIEYEVSYAEKFAEYHHIDDLNKTGEVIKKLYPEYYETFLEVTGSREQYVFNMFAAPKKIADSYAKWLFDICFELEKIIDVSAYDKYRARIYGFLAEELLYVWIKHNKLSYYEAQVIYSQEKAETIELKNRLHDAIINQGYAKAYELFLKVYKERPDVTLDDSDINKDLKFLIAQLTFASNFPQHAIAPKYYHEQIAVLRKADKVLENISKRIRDNDKACMDKLVSLDDEKCINDYAISVDMFKTLMDIQVSYANIKNELLAAVSACAAKQKISVIVLYYSDEFDVWQTCESVAAQNKYVAECIVADALGTLGEVSPEYLQKFSKAGIELRVENVSDQQFDTVAQIKNKAVTLAQYDYCMFVQAGEMLKDNEVQQLCESAYLYPKQTFDNLINLNDTNLARILVNRKAFENIGWWNDSFSSAEDYELVLRACDYNGSEGFRILTSEATDKPVFMETYFTYAYIIGKYADRLRKEEAFNHVFAARYEEAACFGIGDYYIQNSEKMITQSREFKEIDCKTRPILVITGENLCYGVLDRFAENFAQELRKLQLNVRVIDMCRLDMNELSSLSSTKYRAVVGFQTSFYTAELSKGYLLGNVFDCPKFNFVFDHPLYISYYLMMPIENFYVLAQDEGYADYINKYLKKVKAAYHLPPAGNIGCEQQEKIYDISFIGTYNDYRQRLDSIRKLKPDERKLAVSLLGYMKHNPNLPIEESLKNVLVNEGIGDIENDAFAVKLHRMMDVSRVIIFYYREKVIKTLLDNGVKLHVFSDSWKNSPYADNENLIIHGDVDYQESFNVMAQSKLSLNVMSWHKGGMTERVANSMLNGSVCVTDKTSYIERNFRDGKDIVIYDLEKLDELPKRVNELLISDNQAELEAVSRAGFEKASNEHTWKNRAESFIKLLQEIEQN